MDLELVGWPPDGPKLDLDYRSFSYAGKFVMTNTGKALVREDGSVRAAAAFNEDRTEPGTLWIRYITTHVDYRGDGFGPRLLEFVRDRARERDYDTVRIAVNNPFAYEACYRAGFGYTGRETGIAELVLETPADRSRERYQEGLDAFRARDLEEPERAFLERKHGVDPPAGSDGRGE
ncbi:GNAT family N-acetyltransferase [Halalkalicoccus jeotgali]|uniref:GCN5-like N-acetyltransferase n=1 Tax=Halalkalicoccus jeotgali (strain DSM 18796 / CECT 7217 / JCM 14584 / KCTC 4019 / B3) TaxID=795797 RepID=D8J2S7_HALJB|nr:GNAT family N-acetyltransferase [Halalkalicoccus jeotgali]ADJ15034.1 GCN5-related N-acetyltransferase [Halalkalicoccus jeotgali B3]ELY34948.1 GCN5-like N-acetyltransferase [Halalkalicoccus jeotgali B3]